MALSSQSGPGAAAVVEMPFEAYCALRDEQCRIVPEPVDPTFATTRHFTLNPFQICYLHTHHPKLLLSLQPPPTPTLFESLLEYKVFEHLTLTKRLWLMPGLKFGADWLAYAEDPLRAHAKYLVKVLGTGRVGWEELAAAERVANQAKKDLLLAYHNPDAQSCDSLAFCKVRFSK